MPTRRITDPDTILVIAPTQLAFYREVLRGVIDYARLHAHRVTFLMDEPISVSAVKDSRPSGIIAAITNRRILHICKSARVPVVNFSTRLPSTPFPSVTPDNSLVGQLAAQHFLERGFTSFAYLLIRGVHYGRLRLEGFQQALAQRNLSPHVLELASDLAPIDCTRILRKKLPALLRSLKPPVALFASTDHWGWQVLEVARSLNLRIPEDLAVLGADNDLTLCQAASTPMSSVDLQPNAVGAAAAATLIQLIHNPPPPGLPRKTLIPPIQVITRQSTDLLAVADPLIRHALSQIRNPLATPLDVSQLAASAGLSRRTLERRFASLVGHPPGEELRRARLEHARLLLLETDLSIDQIARRAGFDHTSYFCHRFRQSFNHTPTSYRRTFSPRTRRPT